MPRRRRNAQGRFRPQSDAPHVLSAAAPSEDGDPEAVVFICPSLPGTAIALGNQWYTFGTEGMRLTNPDHIAALRAHPWYGGRIREQTAAERAAPPPPMAPAARLVGSHVYDAYRTKLIPDAGGMFRCALCGPQVSPLYTEGGGIAHLQSVHQVKSEGG